MSGILPVMVFYSVYIIIFVKVNKRVLLLYLLSYILRLLAFKRSSGILKFEARSKTKRARVDNVRKSQHVHAFGR